MIGQGGFGTVYAGTLDTTRVAIKQHKDWLNFVREIIIHIDLEHPNIVLLLAICTTPFAPCMIFEYMTLGSLRHLLDNHVSSINEDERQHIGKQVASALNYLHGKDIVHQDIKSHNVLVNELNQQYEAKLSDFGGSRLVNHTTNFGTPAYQAPEVMKKNGRHSKASDVYAFGILLWELESRKIAPDLAQERRGIIKEIPEYTSSKTKTLITSCWKVCPEDRPTAEELLNSLTNDTPLKM